MAKKTDKTRQKKRMQSKERKRQKRQKQRQKASGAPDGFSGSKLDSLGPMGAQKPQSPGAWGAKEPEPPEGFRSAGMAQAMMEYLQPLLDRAGEGADMNNVMSLGMTLYNYALSREKGEETWPSREELLGMMGKELDLGPEEAAVLLQEMVERKHHLLPDRVQPRSGSTMFIRKTGQIEIPEPHPTELLSQFAEPGDSPELGELISCLDRLEQEGDPHQGKEPDDRQKLLNRTAQLAAGCFEDWFRESGGEMDPAVLSQFVRMYVDFVYGYLPQDEGRLKGGVTSEDHEDFLFQHLLRKLYLQDASEYAYAPAAISLFYAFLRCCGWMEEETAQMAAGDVLEQREAFIGMLRREYS